MLFLRRSTGSPSQSYWLAPARGRWLSNTVWSGTTPVLPSQIDYFAGTGRVVAVGLPGTGWPGGTVAWAMGALGEDVATVITHLGFEDVVLVGVPRRLLDG